MVLFGCLVLWIFGGVSYRFHRSAKLTVQYNLQAVFTEEKEIHVLSLGKREHSPETELDSLCASVKNIIYTNRSRACKLSMEIGVTLPAGIRETLL